MLLAVSCGNAFNPSSSSSGTTAVTLEIPPELIQSISSGSARGAVSEGGQKVSLTVYLYVDDKKPIERKIDNFNTATGEEIIFDKIRIGSKVQATASIKIGSKEYSGTTKEVVVLEDGTELTLVLSCSKIYLELSIEEALSQIKTLRTNCSLKITGEVTPEQLQQLSLVTRDMTYAIGIDLDLSETTGLTEIIEPFYGCYFSFALPSSLQDFCFNAFSNFSGLTSISFPNGSDYFVVEDGVLYSKDKTVLYRYIPKNEATSFTIPGSVKIISGTSFQYCSNLEEITIPETVEDMGPIPFLYTYSLKKFNVTNDNFKAVDDVLFTADVKRLIQYPLNKADLSYTVPDTVEMIEENSFSGSKNLKTLNIPASVTEVGCYAFLYASIETLNYADAEGWYNKSNNTYLSPQELQEVSNFTSYDGPKPLCWTTVYKRPLIEVTVGDLEAAINAIEKGNPVILKVTGTLTDEMFQDLYAVIEQKRTGDWEWSSYVGLDLREVIGLTTLHWIGATMIGIPSSVSEIVPGAVSGFDKVLIADNNQYFKYEDDILYNKDKTRLLWYSRNKTNTSFEIPSSVISVDNNSIYCNTYLKEITIPSTLVSLGEGGTDSTGTLYGCHNLKTIRVASDNQYYEVEDGVLFTKGKEKLICYPAKMEGESYNIPKGTKKIVYGAFEYANNLRSITVPDTVIEIRNVFINTNFSSITFENPEGWYIGDNILVTPEQLQDPASYKWSWEGGTGYLINVTISQKTKFGLYYNGIKLSSDSENSYNFEETLEMLQGMGCDYPDDYTNSSYNITLTDSGFVKMISHMDAENSEDEKTAAAVVYNNQLAGFLTADELSNFEATYAQDTDYTVATKVNLTWIYLNITGWQKYQVVNNKYFKLGTPDKGITLNINNLRGVIRFTVEIADDIDDYTNRWKLFDCENVTSESYVLDDEYVTAGETRLYILNIFTENDYTVSESEYLYGTANKGQYMFGIVPDDDGIIINMNTAAQAYMANTYVERRKTTGVAGTYAYFNMNSTEFTDKFVKSGTEYTYAFSPKITDNDTGIIYTPKQIVPVTATGGLGELVIINEPVITVTQNGGELLVNYDTPPELEADLSSLNYVNHVDVDFLYIDKDGSSCLEIQYLLKGYTGQWDVPDFWYTEHTGKILIPNDNRYRVIVEGLEGLDGKYYVESYNATNLSGMPQEITIPK